MGGWRCPSSGPSSAHFLLVACAFWARYPTLETFKPLLPSPLPPNTPLYSFKDYFLSAPDVNKASTHTPILHLSHHSLSPTGFLLVSLHLHLLHKLFPPI